MVKIKICRGLYCPTVCAVDVCPLNNNHLSRSYVRLQYVTSQSMTNKIHAHVQSVYIGLTVLHLEIIRS